jgi:hypothetical protein
MIVRIVVAAAMILLLYGMMILPLFLYVRYGR